MSKDNKDMHQAGWMVPPTAPFGHSKLDHKIKEAEELTNRIDEWAKGEDTNEWTNPNGRERGE